MSTDDPPIDATKYSYSVIWSDEDQCHVGLCTEFPSMSFLGSPQSEVLAGITKLIADTLEDMRRLGETAPEPIRPHTRNSRVAILIRISPDLHRALIARANEQGISLNRLCCDLLAKRWD